MRVLRKSAAGAAISHGAVAVDDGEWVIVKWANFQQDSNNATRCKRYRDTKKEPKTMSRHATRVSTRNRIEKNNTSTSNLPNTRAPSKPETENKSDMGNMHVGKSEEIATRLQNVVIEKLKTLAVCCDEEIAGAAKIELFRRGL